MRNFAAMFKKGHIIALLAGILILTSCSEFQKVMKDGTREEKYEMAMKMYNDGSYYQALQLYDELLILYRNDMKIRDIYYHYAYAYYNQKDYVLASYHFKYFARTFPKTERAQECLYMAAYCKYLDSAPSDLDQTSTNDAIREMQLFINMYPKSPRVKDANAIIDKLRVKLVNKDFEKAKSYFTTEFYKSATYALKLHPKSYPSSPHIEEAYYLAARSSYLYGKNSIVLKQTERYQAAIVECDFYLSKYPEGEFKNEVERYKKLAQGNIKSIAKRLSSLHYSKARENIRTGKYEQAIKSLSEHKENFGKSEYSERAAYQLVRAYYKYAKDADTEKQAELYKNCIKAAKAYQLDYADGKYLSKVNKMLEKAQKSLAKN